MRVDCMRPILSTVTSLQLVRSREASRQIMTCMAEPVAVRIVRVRQRDGVPECFELLDEALGLTLGIALAEVVATRGRGRLQRACDVAPLREAARATALGMARGAIATPRRRVPGAAAAAPLPGTGAGAASND
jgi:hypothetical protein